VRVIAGKLRGKTLGGFRGNAVRPTSDRIREAIFSALLSRMGSFEQTRVLDMFAGTGALAIESLSRGAALAVLFDDAPASQQLIARNLQACRLEESVRLHRGDAFKLLPKAASWGPFDVVFIDPPYGKGLAEKALLALTGAGLLHEGSWVVVETGRDETLPEEVGSLELSLQRDYGTSSIRYYTVNIRPEG